FQSLASRMCCRPAATPESTRVTVELDGRSMPALLDSGSTITLVLTNVLPKNSKPGGDNTGVIQNLPVPVLLGYDWTGFSDMMKAPTQARQPQKPRAWIKPVRMARRVTREGSFGREQKEDDQLKHCWGQVLQVEGVNTHPGNQLPAAYFLIKGGLLYYHPECHGEPCDLLVVPHTWTALLLHLAHTHPLGRHLGPRKTLENLKDHFTWPRMQMEVQAFCQACPRCQQTALFERVGMDLVGPLLKSVRGHEYILVMMDYATRYPEAVPLRKATSRNIARELVTLFSRVRVPKDILTDQDEAREAWEGQQSPFHSMIDYVQDVQVRIDQVGPIIKEHMEAAQRDQQRIYNRPAQPREFYPGDQVMLLVPNTVCMFLAKWQGPYIVLEWVGPVNYRLQQPDPQEHALVRRGKELSPAQQQDITELID
ncbi:hypothetical protein QTP86_024513, partial [Hemibagrus guttatus]